MPFQGLSAQIDPVDGKQEIYWLRNRWHIIRIPASTATRRAQYNIISFYSFDRNQFRPRSPRNHHFSIFCELHSCASSVHCHQALWWSDCGRQCWNNLFPCIDRYWILYPSHTNTCLGCPTLGWIPTGLDGPRRGWSKLRASVFKDGNTQLLSHYRWGSVTCEMYVDSLQRPNQIAIRNKVKESGKKTSRPPITESLLIYSMVCEAW